MGAENINVNTVSRNNVLKAVFVTLSGGFLVSCSDRGINTLLPAETLAEKEAKKLLIISKGLLEHPHMKVDMSIPLTQIVAEGKLKPVDASKLFDLIKEPYKDELLADFNIASVLTYAAAHSGRSSREAIGVYEAAKEKFSDNRTAGDMAALVLSNGSDMRRVFNTHDEVVKKTNSLKWGGMFTNWNTIATLTSTAMNVGVGRALEDYQAINNEISSDSSLCSAILANSISRRTADIKHLVEIYKKTRKEFTGFLGVVKMDESFIAGLTIASIMGKHSIDETLSMYDYFDRSGVTPYYNIVRMVMAGKSDQPMITRTHVESTTTYINNQPHTTFYHYLVPTFLG